MGGSNRFEGRVEVYHREHSSGVWGTICNDYWGYSDSKVSAKHSKTPFHYTTEEIPRLLTPTANPAMSQVPISCRRQTENYCFVMLCVPQTCSILGTTFLDGECDMLGDLLHENGTWIKHGGIISSMNQVYPRNRSQFPISHFCYYSGSLFCFSVLTPFHGNFIRGLTSSRSLL